MPIMSRSAKLFLATKGNSANPGQANRCNAMTSGDSPDVTPWRAATKPKAQNKAAPAPQAMPKAVGYFSVSDRALSIRLRIANSACAGKKLESAGRRDAPVLETHHMCSDLAHFRGDMADINHRNVSLITQAHEIRQDFSLVTGIERGERLVEQQKPRLHQQSPPDGDPLAFATRKQAGPPRQQVADAEQADDALEFDRLARSPTHAPAVFEVLPHVEMREQPAFLKHVADRALMRRHIDAALRREQGRLIQRDGTAVRLQQTGDHVDERSFSGSRGAEQSGSAAGGIEAYAATRRAVFARRHPAAISPREIALWNAGRAIRRRSVRQATTQRQPARAGPLRRRRPEFAGRYRSPPKWSASRREYWRRK